MQYLKLVGLGPSLKTWPKCEPHCLQVTSILFIPCDASSSSVRLSCEITSKKLGHPDLESYLCSDENSSLSQHMHL